MFGGNPDGERHGFRYRRDPDAFLRERPAEHERGNSCWYRSWLSVIPTSTIIKNTFHVGINVSFDEIHIHGLCCWYEGETGRSGRDTCEQ
ncbi:hypothetical protein CDV36_013725 [Fusarium kuroshium]|uniref:Uncharacterized protein n=1 Tax=Fusarium kuroshium TaxID=2010991 RepID=A0A3M2RMZ2_9HYPO|nr:hypothetical protein CDV36_013725 [Fusarium kuroshium]